MPKLPPAALHYRTEIEKELAPLLTPKSIRSKAFSDSLTKTIARCFRIPATEVTTSLKAECILDILLEKFSAARTKAPVFHLSAFIQEYMKDQVEINHLLTAFLNGIYFGDINLRGVLPKDTLPHHNHLELLMLQLLAENSSAETVRRVLAQLPLDTLVVLIYYCFKHYREGSYILLKETEDLLMQHHDSDEARMACQLLLKLLKGLRCKYFEINKLESLLMKLSEITPEILAVLLSTLEAYGEERTQSIHTMFNELIPLMINTLEDSGWQRNLKNIYETYLHRCYTFDDFLTVTRLFGLEGHAPLLPFKKKVFKENTLVERIQVLLLIFSHPSLFMLAKKKEKKSYYEFANTFIMYLDAIHHAPLKFKTGLDKMTFAIATKSRALADLPSLTSVVNGLGAVVGFLNTKLDTPLSLKDYPVFIFDQSDPVLMASNRSFIGQLTRERECSIVHVSQEETMALATLLGVEKLILTSRSGSFGYAGARNCVYLLTPVLHGAYQRGCSTVAEVLKMGRQELQGLFQKETLGAWKGTTPGISIFRTDDDLEIPAATFFSNALFSEAIQNHYLECQSQFVGRGTIFNAGYKTLSQILKNPRDIFLWTKWFSVPHTTVMVHVTQPKFCINIPFGAEEAHLISPNNNTLMVQPAIHLPGTRYPAKQIPINFFIGLDEYAKKHIPYTIPLTMSFDLIDPTNRYHSRTTPWNTPSTLSKFTSLRSAFACVAKKSTKAKMQKRFWKNIQTFFYPITTKPTYFRKNMDDLLGANVDAIIHTVEREGELSKEEKESLQRLGDVYKFFQQDAVYFTEFGKEVMLGIKEGIPDDNWYEVCVDRGVDIAGIIESTKLRVEQRHGITFLDYPLTEALYLLYRAVGTGTFCDIVANLNLDLAK